METHDFTAAKVGDKVSHPIYGNGVIVEIDRSSYPLDVKFSDGVSSFKADGSDGESRNQCLYNGHNTFQIIATPVSPYKDGEWIAVSVDCKRWGIERFIKMDGYMVVAVDDNDEMGKYQYHKSLTELNSELNNL